MDALRLASGITDRMERSNRPPVRAEAAGVSMSSTFEAILRRIK